MSCPRPHREQIRTQVLSPSSETDARRFRDVWCTGRERLESNAWDDEDAAAYWSLVKLNADTVTRPRPSACTRAPPRTGTLRRSRCSISRGRRDEPPHGPPALRRIRRHPEGIHAPGRLEGEREASDANRDQGTRRGHAANAGAGIAGSDGDQGERKAAAGTASRGRNRGSSSQRRTVRASSAIARAIWATVSCSTRCRCWMRWKVA